MALVGGRVRRLPCDPQTDNKSFGDATSACRWRISFNFKIDLFKLLVFACLIINEINEVYLLRYLRFCFAPVNEADIKLGFFLLGRDSGSAPHRGPGRR